MHNCQKLGTFLFRLKTKQGFPLSQLLCTIVLESLANVIRQGKKTECIQNGNEEMKTLSFVDDMVGYGESSKEMAKKPPRTNKQV